MRSATRALPISVLFAATLLAACNALTGVDDLQAGRSPDGGRAPAPTDAGEAGRDGASATDGGDVSSPPATPDSGAPAVLDEGFDDASDCLGWSVFGAGTRQPHADGHLAAGSCQLCATAAGSVFLEKTVTAPQAGRYELSTWAKRLGGATPVGFSAVLLTNGGMVSTGLPLSSSAWTEAGNLKFPFGSSASITMRVGVDNAATGDCILVDDVVVTLN